jgi:hypothetical protein
MLTFSSVKSPVARALQCLGVAALVVATAGLVERAHAASPRAAQPAASARQPATALPAAMALRFEPNRGQFEEPVRFLARGPGFGLYLTPDGATLALHHRASVAGPQNAAVAHGRDELDDVEDEIVRVHLVGASATEPVGTDELPGHTNYFVGRDPQRWKTGVESYARVTYRSALPGVDVAYYGTQGGQLEYDLLLAAGVDASSLQLELDGVDSIELDSRGDAALRLRSGALLHEKAPLAYQTDAQGRRGLVPVRYRLVGKHGLGFAIGPHDATRPLVIDPVLSYAIYLGAQNFDQLFGVATDGAGNTYAVGYTTGVLFPTTAPLQVSFHGGGSDAVICKLNAAGTGFTYATYLGGTNADQAYAVAADAAGNAVVTGVTYSSDFPLANAFQATPGGSGTADAFVLKLNSAGSALIYSTYLGGGSDEFPGGVAINNATGSTRVVGQTFSGPGAPPFPTSSAFQPAFGGGSDAFITSFGAGGALEFSSFLGGNNSEYATGVAIAPSGEIFITGWTKSFNFPTLGAFQDHIGGGVGGTADAFLTRLNAAGSAVLSSTFLGGSGTDLATGIAIQSGSAVVVGSTNSNNFPTLAAAQASLASPGLTDAFVTRFTPSGSGLVFSTYWGGSADDAAAGVAADADNSYVVGQTASTNFPQIDAFRGPAALGAADAFMAAYKNGGAAAYSTYLGGNNTDSAVGVAIQAGQKLHIVGNTFSPDLPVIAAPVGYESLHGSQDGFIVRSPLLIGRIAVSAGGWASLALLGALLLGLGAIRHQFATLAVTCRHFLGGASEAHEARSAGPRVQLLSPVGRRDRGGE